MAVERSQSDADASTPPHLQVPVLRRACRAQQAQLPALQDAEGYEGSRRARRVRIHPLTVS